MKFKRIALIGKYQAPGLASQVILLANHLKGCGCTVSIDCGDYCALDHFAGFNTGKIKELCPQLDLVIVIGGDGTLLSVAREIADCDIPVVGVNQGKLGFMTDIAIDTMLASLDEIVVEEKYQLELRSMIYAQVVRQNKVVMQKIALNDVVISRGAIGNMIEFDLQINNEFVLSQKADGVIFATPTGSTAYSLAAGGAILHPNACVFSIVPICPQSLSNRPLVVPDNASIEFILVRENATQIHVDGQECFDLIHEDKVVLTKHVKQFKLLHPKGYNYFHTLRNKLDWSKRVS